MVLVLIAFPLSIDISQYDLNRLSFEIGSNDMTDVQKDKLTKINIKKLMYDYKQYILC